MLTVLRLWMVNGCGGMLKWRVMVVVVVGGLVVVAVVPVVVDVVVCVVTVAVLSVVVGAAVGIDAGTGRCCGCGGCRCQC